MRTSLAYCMFVAAACGGPADSSSADAPELSGDKYTITFGPITVPSMGENTQCIQVRLTNSEPIKVHQMHNVLGVGSHHLIVYKDDMMTAEQTTPFDCQPFTGTLNPSGRVAPIMITQRADDPLFLPAGVGYSLAANQMMRVEMHFNNSTDAPLQVMATVELYAAKPGEVQHEANILFIGSPDIDIPPMGTQTLEQFFTPSRASLDLTQAKFFAITGHTHQFGREMTVAAAPSQGSAGAMVYQPEFFDWDEPATQIHNPEFKLDTGNQAGFRFKCVYQNTSNARVKFGESANDEMCFFWAYYYPSQGAHVCVHTEQFGVDLCCPDAGPNLCNMFNNF